MPLPLIVGYSLIKHQRYYPCEMKRPNPSPVSLLFALFLAPLTWAQSDWTIPRTFTGEAGRYLEARNEVDGFYGAVLVSHRGKPVLRQGFGPASVEFDIPNRPETKFRLGSVTKQFTAAAIMLLEARGKLRVSDSICKHLKDCPENWSGLTVHHLLSHTGALPKLSVTAPIDTSGLVRAAPTSPPKGLRDLVPPTEKLPPLDATPGTRFGYSNYGYMILGWIIEAAGGKPYGQFLAEELFRPLGMNDTRCEQPDRVVLGKASGYRRAGGTIVPAEFVDLRFPGAAGCVYSTVDDLARWDTALRVGHPIPHESSARMWTPNLAKYGYGWWIESLFGREAQWHRGNVQGAVAIALRFPKEELFVTVLSNVEGTPVRAIANELAAIAFGDRYELPRRRQRIEVDSSALDRIVARYAKDSDPSDTFQLVRDGKRLMMSIPGARPFELTPESPSAYFTDFGFVLQFEAGSESRVLWIQNDGLWVRWSRRDAPE